MNVSEECNYDRVYTSAQERNINDEFGRLEGQCYLEHAGATLYSERQLQDVFAELSNNIFANPHARNNSSKLTEDVIDQVRFEVLRHFNTNPQEYSLIFTSGATASLKLIAENFIYNDAPSNNTGNFVYLLDNHTSVLGMREYAQNTVVLTKDELSEIFSSKASNVDEEDTNSLFVYPAQSNFSGTKYPLGWIDKVHKNALNGHHGLNSKRWFVVLDAACFVSTNPLDLSKHKPDFVTVSFYKIFGYPTGLGALIVRNCSAYCLDKKYFGGGTVLMVLAKEKVRVPRNVLCERFEDGTLPFLSIVALRHGFLTIERLGLNFSLISRHTFELARYVYANLSMYHHCNGKPVAIIYQDTNFKHHDLQGGIVNFNLLRSTGKYIGYSEVLHVSMLYNIHLRTGCFCNQGACQIHLKLTSEDVKNNFNKGHVCGDQKDLIDGYPTGSVRISFGYMSTKKDADTFLSMIRDYFVTKPLVKRVPKEGENIHGALLPDEKLVRNNSSGRAEHKQILECDSRLSNFCDSAEPRITGRLEHAFIYPIKSCGGFEISESWKLVSTGMEYDRQWMIVNASGVCVTQKHDPQLCLIKPRIDLDHNLMILSFPGCNSITIPLTPFENETCREALPCQSKVCGDRIQGWDCGDDVANWLDDALGTSGFRLLRHFTNNTREGARSSPSGQSKKLSLVNKAQFLLINKTSVQWLLDDIPNEDFPCDINNLIDRFRPNLVVSLPEHLLENYLQDIRIGNTRYSCQGSCTRCQMICIDQSSSEKTVEPLRTLSRKLNGKISFGIYLQINKIGSPAIIKIGDSVICK